MEQIDLISNKEIGPYIYFSQLQAYNNGVYILNNICKKFYSNKSLGIYARSLNMNDIEKHLNEKGINARDSYENTAGRKYGEKYTFSNAIYPTIYEQENGGAIDNNTIKTDGIGASDSGINMPIIEETSKNATKLTATQTFYEVTFSEDFDEEFNYIFPTHNDCWIATRYVDCKSRAEFGLYWINREEIGTNDSLGRFHSGSNPFNYLNGALRPVVSLGPNIKINVCDEPNGSDEDHMHSISL